MRTDRHDDAISNFANAPKIWSSGIYEFKRPVKNTFINKLYLVLNMPYLNLRNPTIVKKTARTLSS